MSTLRIIIYFLLIVFIIQIIRQIINILNLKYFPKKCIENSKVIKASNKDPNILLIGDDIVLGSGLFNCKDNLNHQLSYDLKANVYTYGKAGLKARDCYDFLKANWYDIYSRKYDAVILSIGSNDILSYAFDIDTKYFKKAINFLKKLTKNVYLIGPKDMNNDKVVVFPFDIIIKSRVSKLFDILQTIAYDTDIKLIDVKKEMLYHCRNGKYCRIDNGLNLDENGYLVYTRAIKKVIDI